jgi:hypothetical protein
LITGVYIAAAAVAVFVIAAVVIGREARRLDAVAPRAVYDPEQAVEFVADMLPEVTQARLTPDELSAMLVLHMRWLHAQGMQPDRVVDRRQEIDELLLITEDQLSAYLLSEAEKSGVELLDDVDVVHVVRAHLAYFDAIGAVGPTASSTDL